MTGPSGKFFDAKLIDRITRHELTARRIVDGFLAGRNRSDRHGFSVEFVEHREYVPGDDLRHLDWKVLGRLGRYYVKRYEEETNITCVICADVSRSMSYGSGEWTKFEVAAFVASALSYLLSRQRDAVGLALFDDEVRTFLPPTVRRVMVANVAQKLLHAELNQGTDIEASVKRICVDLPQRSLFVILSDFFADADRFEAVMKFLSARGHDAIVIQIVDAAERDFPFGSNVQFRGLEDARELIVEPRRVRARYLELFERHVTKLRGACQRVGCDYLMLTAGEPIAPALETALAARTRGGVIRRRGAGS